MAKISTTEYHSLREARIARIIEEWWTQVKTEVSHETPTAPSNPKQVNENLAERESNP